MLEKRKSALKFWISAAIFTFYYEPRSKFLQCSDEKKTLPDEFIRVCCLLKQFLDKTVHFRLQRLANMKEDDRHCLDCSATHLGPKVLDTLQHHILDSLGLGFKNLIEHFYENINIIGVIDGVIMQKQNNNIQLL